MKLFGQIQVPAALH